MKPLTPDHGIEEDVSRYHSLASEADKLSMLKTGGLIKSCAHPEYLFFEGIIISLLTIIETL